MVMSIDSGAFRHAAGQFVTGVTVVAVEVDGEIRGITANSFTSLSLDPPLVLFCLGKDTKTGQADRTRAAGFSVNILQQAQLPLSDVLRRGLAGDGAAPVHVCQLGRGPAARGLRRGDRLRRARHP